MNISEIQLFAILQDTVMHIQHGQHLAPNYHYLKQEILKAFGVTNKRTSSKALLAYIGHVYIEVFEDRQKFESYVTKHNLKELYNEQVNKLATD